MENSTLYSEINVFYVSLHYHFTQGISVLDLNNNKIVDISALKYLKNLTGLSLENNKIRDFSALKGLNNLKKFIMIRIEFRVGLRIK